MGSSQSISSRILVLGIDGAGKTSFLSKYENPGEAQEQVQPTDGFIVKDVKVKGVKLNVWDVAGKEATRSLWKHYYEQGHTDAIIWVVDSADSQERLEESRSALQGALLDPHLQGTLYFYMWFSPGKTPWEGLYSHHLFATHLPTLFQLVPHNLLPRPYSPTPYCTSRSAYPTPWACWKPGTAHGVWATLSNATFQPSRLCYTGAASFPR